MKFVKLYLRGQNYKKEVLRIKKVAMYLSQLISAKLVKSVNEKLNMVNRT